MIFRDPAAWNWLDDISESNSTWSAILAVIHLEFYDANQETFNQPIDAKF